MCKNSQSQGSVGVLESDCEFKPYRVVANGQSCPHAIEMCPHCRAYKEKSGKERVDSLFKRQQESRGSFSFSMIRI